MFRVEIVRLTQLINSIIFAPSQKKKIYIYIRKTCVHISVPLMAAKIASVRAESDGFSSTLKFWRWRPLLWVADSPFSALRKPLGRFGSLSWDESFCGGDAAFSVFPLIFIAQKMLQTKDLLTMRTRKTCHTQSTRIHYMCLFVCVCVRGGGACVSLDLAHPTGNNNHTITHFVLVSYIISTSVEKVKGMVNLMKK